MGLYNPRDAEQLTSWLVKNLDAISDAEPLALAKYILELLSMWTTDPESEVKPRLIEELTDFLQKESGPFVDRLLAALRSKSFLPYDSPNPPPRDSFSHNSNSRGKKRGLDQDEIDRTHERELRGPPKGPRLGNDRLTRRPPDGPRSRSQRPHERDNSRSHDKGSYSDGPDGRAIPRPSSPSATLENGKERCRDYYERGYCNRGAACPYSHGEDAVVANGMGNVMPMPFPLNMDPTIALQLLNGLFPPGYPPGFMPPNFGIPPPYHPADSQISMQINGQQPEMPGFGVYDPSLGGGPSDGPQPPRNGPGAQSSDDIIMLDDQLQDNNAPKATNFVRHERGASRGGGRGRGSRPERSHRTNVVDPNAVTIVVEKLPPEKTNIADLTTYFGKFGTVTNVAVDPRGNRALVSFSNHQEANAAWKSEEAVFGNRFVVIFWHRPAPGGGAAGQKALEASAQKVQRITSGINGGEDTRMDATTSTKSQESIQDKSTNGHGPLEDTEMSAPRPKKPERMSPQEVFEYAQRVWMEKMKVVMDIMQSSTTSEAEKLEAKAKFKVLKSQKPQPPKTPPQPAATSGTTGSKEKIDIDLDLLASGEAQNLTQEEAQKALARLQELAAEKGLDTNEMDQDIQAGSTPYNAYRGGGFRGRSWRGGYRGRGRGRGAAMAMASASLDNRTKKIILQGYEAGGVSGDVALEMAQSYYLPSGQAEDVQLAETGIVVTFANRSAAEVASDRNSLPSRLNNVFILLGYKKWSTSYRRSWYLRSSMVQCTKPKSWHGTEGYYFVGCPTRR
ncbi:hypothetical protein FRC20_008926 [Serendipita sp. 405]|nr:hypothetical protein FRC20_008926 [Serendipita sp. 405]